MSHNSIELKKIYKTYGNSIILDDINLYVKQNEFVTLLGPSGCGKTTTLRLIGGFETPTSGDIFFDGKSILGIPAYKRKVNTVFQKYALFPHLNIEDNISFGLKIKKMKTKQIEQKVKNALKLVNLSGYEKRDISSLSGGQQQRIAIARAIVNEPEILLLDEPLGALDLKLRQEMQSELKNMQQQLGITFIYVTHDQEEALTMSDTIVVMNEGKIQQIGNPEDIYNEPKNAFVADFIGQSNILTGQMLEDKLVQFCDTRFPCVDQGFDKNEKVDIVLRPEDVEIVEQKKGQITGKVTSVTFKGVHYEMIIHCYRQIFKVHSTKMYAVGEEVGVFVAPNSIHVMKKVV